MHPAEKNDPGRFECGWKQGTGRLEKDETQEDSEISFLQRHPHGRRSWGCICHRSETPSRSPVRTHPNLGASGGRDEGAVALQTECVGSLESGKMAAPPPKMSPAPCPPVSGFGRIAPENQKCAVENIGRSGAKRVVPCCFLQAAWHPKKEPLYIQICTSCPCGDGPNP